MTSASRPRLLSSLRWRLSSAISSLVLLCIVACVAGAVIFLHQSLTNRAHDDLQQSLGGVSQYMRSQRGDLLGTARLVASDRSVATAVTRGTSEPLIVSLLPYYADLNVDVIDVVDRHGTVLVRMENTFSRGDSLLGVPSVNAALRGSEQVGLENGTTRPASGTGYALRATVPVRSGSRVIGAVVVGRQFSSIYAARIGQALNAQVNLIAGGRRTGTTLTDAFGLPATGSSEPPAVLRHIAGGHTFIEQVNEGGRTALSGVVPLTDPQGHVVGAVEVVSFLTPLYDLITQLSYLLIALGAVVVILGTLLGLALARRLTRRLLTLEETASHVAEAAHSDAPLYELYPSPAVSGDDEVASLSRSLAAMMSALDERMLTNTRLYEAAQARVRELSGLAEIARLLTAMPSLRETLDLLAQHVRGLMDCDAVAIVLPGEGSEPFATGGYGFSAGDGRGADTPILVPQSGAAVDLRQALETGEIVWQPLQGPANIRVVDVAGPWAGATVVPLEVQERAVGALICHTRDGVAFDEPDISLLTTVADQVAVAVENARLSAHSRDLAALEERARLARELHDSVTQALFSMTLHARTAQLALSKLDLEAPGILGQSVSELLQLTQGALAEMRALIFELRPGALAEEGLIAALQKQAAAVSAREGIAIEVRTSEERIPLEPMVEEHLYRLALEALHNAVKHAGAQTIRIDVHVDEADRVVVAVADDGCGFDLGSVPPGHMGLASMAGRAQNIGGVLEITSTPNQGTTVCVTAPTVPADAEIEAHAIVKSGS